MATQCSVYCKFSDGTFASLVNTAVNDTDGSAGHNINTIQTGGNGLAQVSSVDIGQAFVGKLLTHAIGVWSTEDSNSRRRFFRNSCSQTSKARKDGGW